jgi:hypothetical protein
MLENLAFPNLYLLSDSGADFRKQTFIERKDSAERSGMNGW